MTKEKSIEERINLALDKVRPSLQADGGDVEFIKWDDENKTVQVRMVGMCAGCPMAQMTLKQGIEVEIRKAVPEVREVIGV
jgi:Fe-S cluster biogenesis protein NfuA